MVSLTFLHCFGYSILDYFPVLFIGDDDGGDADIFLNLSSTQLLVQLQLQQGSA